MLRDVLMAAGSQGPVRLVAVFSKAEQPENLKFTEETQSEMSPHPAAPHPLLRAASAPAAGPGSTYP